MLDVSGRGHISLEQYKQAMDTLGVRDYNEHPSGAETNKINEETFTKEASFGLQQHYQSYFQD